MPNICEENYIAMLHTYNFLFLIKSYPRKGQGKTDLCYHFQQKRTGIKQLKKNSITSNDLEKSNKFRFPRTKLLQIDVEHTSYNQLTHLPPTTFNPSLVKSSHCCLFSGIMKSLDLKHINKIPTISSYFSLVVLTYRQTFRKIRENSLSCFF